MGGVASFFVNCYNFRTCLRNLLNKNYSFVGSSQEQVVDNFTLDINTYARLRGIEQAVQKLSTWNLLQLTSFSPTS